MKTKFNLEINTPCSENSNEFMPTEKGGFCKACEKEVIDFTTMTSTEIITYFKDNQENKTCGKFEKHQLAHTYQEFQQKKNYTIFKTIGFAMMSFFSINIQGQETKPATEISPKKAEKTTSSQDGIIVSGTVGDDYGGLPSAIITLEGTEKEIEADFHGKFKFPEPLQKGDVLVFRYMGMLTQKIKIENSSELVVILKDDDNLMACEMKVTGEVQIKKVFNSKKKKGFWKKSDNK